MNPIKNIIGNPIAKVAIFTIAFYLFYKFGVSDSLHKRRIANLTNEAQQLITLQEKKQDS